MQSLFEIKNLNCTKESPSQKTVIFEKADLTISDNGIFVIMGESGCGKSTFLRFLNRLEDPNEGDIAYQNQSIYDFPITDLRKKIGMLFQLPSLPEKTVMDNLNFGPHLKGQKLSDEDAGELLSMVDLSPSLTHHPAKELSIGQQQRVALARVLAGQPEVLLLDEPTASLDEATTLKIEETIQKLVSKDNLSAIWVTHNKDQAKRLGNQKAQIKERKFHCEI